MMEMQDRSAADRVAHNHKAGGSTPSPASTFSRTMAHIGHEGMAATMVEGTARKQVRTVNARTQRKRGWPDVFRLLGLSLFKGDSRKDGISSNGLAR